jgi:hypothetical protein
MTSVPPPRPGVDVAVPFTLPPAAAPGVEQQSLRPPMRATVQGTLDKTPMIQLLVFMLDNRLTGTLLLNDKERGRCAIYIERGEPCNVRTPILVSPLGEVLLRMGFIDTETLGDALESVARSKQLLGHYLVARRIVSAEDLQSALKQQLINKIAYTFQFNPTTRYAFYDEEDLLADYGGAQRVPCEPLSLVMMGARFASDAAIEQVLSSLGNGMLSLHAEAEPERLGLEDAELAIVTRLRESPTTLAELRGTFDSDDVSLTTYALVITRSIDLSEGTRSPVGFAQTTEEALREQGDRYF